jgi:hypothetical protein
LDSETERSLLGEDDILALLFLVGSGSSIDRDCRGCKSSNDGGETHVVRLRGFLKLFEEFS